MRLTTSIRNHISRAAIAAAFDGRKEEMKKREAALLRKVYESVIPQSEREAVAKLHKCWFATTRHIRLNVNGSRIELNTDQGFRVPAGEYGKDGWSSNFATIKAGPLADEIMTHCNAKEDLQKECNAAEAATDALLNSVTTLNALMKTWPEGEPYWSEYLNKPATPSLPALQVSEVNRMLGLPKPEAKAA